MDCGGGGQKRRSPRGPQMKDDAGLRVEQGQRGKRHRSERLSRGKVMSSRTALAQQKRKGLQGQICSWQPEGQKNSLWKAVAHTSSGRAGDKQCFGGVGENGGDECTVPLTLKQARPTNSVRMVFVFVCVCFLCFCFCLSLCWANSTADSWEQKQRESLLRFHQPLQQKLKLGGQTPRLLMDPLLVERGLPRESEDLSSCVAT